jgi:hypothetical protein
MGAACCIHSEIDATGRVERVFPRHFENVSSLLDLI